jgi:hypothetical protein
MAVEDDPGYPRWRAAQDNLVLATERLKEVPEGAKAAAERDLAAAQFEYDAASAELN